MAKGVARCEGLDGSAITLDVGAVRVVRVRYAVARAGVGTILVSARAPGSEGLPIDVGGINLNACEGRCR